MGDPWKQAEPEGNSQLVGTEEADSRRGSFGSLDQDLRSPQSWIERDAESLEALQAHPKPHRGAGLFASLKEQMLSVLGRGTVVGMPRRSTKRRDIECPPQQASRMEQVRHPCGGVWEPDCAIL